MMDTEACHPALPQQGRAPDAAGGQATQVCPPGIASVAESHPSPLQPSPGASSIHPPTSTGLWPPGHFVLHGTSLINHVRPSAPLQIGRHCHSEICHSVTFLCLDLSFPSTFHACGFCAHFLIIILRTKVHLRLCLLPEESGLRPGAGCPAGDAELRACDEVGNGSTKERNKRHCVTVFKPHQKQQCIELTCRK